MSANPASVDQYFKAPFILEGENLSRIVLIMQERFSIARLEFSPKFEVRFSDGTEMELHAVDEVLHLDNSVRNPIIGLSIKASAYADDNESVHCTVTYQHRFGSTVDLHVSGRNAAWTDGLARELQQQIERTLSDSFIHSYMNRDFALTVTFVVFTVLLFVALIVTLLSSQISPSPRMNTFPALTQQDQRELSELASESTTMEKKVDFLFQLEARQLANHSESPAKASSAKADIYRMLSLRNLMVIIPIILVVGVSYYTLRRYYPKAVFLWGDMEKQYQRVESMRRLLWIVVVVGPILGIIASLFVQSLPSL